VLQPFMPVLFFFAFLVSSATMTLVLLYDRTPPAVFVAALFAYALAAFYADFWTPLVQNGPPAPGRRP
jgi:hypothetical protein